MVPIDEQEDHVLTIETTSAVPAPAAPLKASAPPAILSSSASGKVYDKSARLGSWQCLTMIARSTGCTAYMLINCCSACVQCSCLFSLNGDSHHAGTGNSRVLSGATQSGKLVVPDWAGPTGSKAGPPPTVNEASSPQRKANAPAGPYGYQPDFMNKQAAGPKQPSGEVLSRGNSSASLLMSAAGSSHEGEGGGSVSKSGSPISRQSSLLSVPPGAAAFRQPPVIGGRARRPSLLGVPALHMSSLHALPENDAYLGPLNARSPRRTASFLTGPPTSIMSRNGSLELESTFDPMTLLPLASPRRSPRRTSSFLTGSPTGVLTRKGSAERESAFDATMPPPQNNVLDASLTEPEILDHAIMSLPLDLSRHSTSASLEATAASTQVLPVVQVSMLFLHSSISCYSFLMMQHPMQSSVQQLS